jgi:hypothetical protein
MDDPAQKVPRLAPAGPGDVDEFADIPTPRTRHPVLAICAGLLAIFLVVKMRGDLAFFLSSSQPADLGEARALLANPKAPEVLAQGVNRLVRLRGIPDRESALQVDTKGSWTFTQFFRLLGTQSRIFVHRREDPLPAFRAEDDVFEGRLMRFSDLPFEEAIRSYEANHVTATHFFKAADLQRAVAAGVSPTTTLTDLAGDPVTLGPNDILAIELRHPGEVEVGLPAARFPTAEAARAAITAKGASVIGPGRTVADRQTWVISVTPETRDKVMNDVGAIDYQSELRDVRETVKLRLSDLAIAGGALAARGTADGAAAPSGGARTLTNIDTIRTLATVQVPPDAYLIVEAETPRDHLSDAAIAAVLLGFAGVNLSGLLRSRRPRTRPRK